MSTILKPIESKTKHLDYFLSQCHRRKYPSKSTIIYAGDKSDSLFYIIKGSVTVIIEDDDGREMIMAYLNAGDFFGEMGNTYQYLLAISVAILFGLMAVVRIKKKRWSSPSYCEDDHDEEMCILCSPRKGR